MSVGTDHIDNRECKKRGVFVVNTPDIASDSAADLTVALVLMTTRRLVEGKKKTYHWTGPQAPVARVEMYTKCRTAIIARLLYFNLCLSTMSDSLSCSFTNNNVG
jgi:lactate dehydrogenase-like 2-hydroxyacid dehydrogenase